MGSEKGGAHESVDRVRGLVKKVVAEIREVVRPDTDGREGQNKCSYLKSVCIQEMCSGGLLFSNLIYLIKREVGGSEMNRKWEDWTVGLGELQVCLDQVAIIKAQ